MAALFFCVAPRIVTRRPSTPATVLRCTVSSPSNQTDESTAVPSQDNAFSEWASENNVDMSALALTSCEPDAQSNMVGNRGMIALSPLKRGDQLISVKSSITLQVSSLDAKKTPFPSKLSQRTWARLPWYGRLAILLLDAKQQDDSALQPWLSRLPSFFDTPFHWSDKELLELQNPRMVEAIHEQKKQYRKLFDEISGNTDNPIGRKLEYADFVWAIECIRSRAFSGPLEAAPFKERLRLLAFILSNTLAWPSLHVLPWENALNGGLTALFALTVYDIIFPKILRLVQGVELKRYAMTPGIDLINHSSLVTGKADVSYEYFTDRFVVKAGEDYHEGDQVFVSYGAQSNDSLLQFYGFVEDDNLSETYTFGADVARLLGTQENNLIYRNRGFDEKTIQAVSKKLGNNKEFARAALRDLCSAELAGLPTTLQEDLAMLKSGQCENDARLKIAVRYRIEKKKLLSKDAK